MRVRSNNDWNSSDCTASGHDFSHAEKSQKTLGFSPCGTTAAASRTIFETGSEYESLF